MDLPNQQQDLLLHSVSSHPLCESEDNETCVAENQNQGKDEPEEEESIGLVLIIHQVFLQLVSKTFLLV